MNRKIVDEHSDSAEEKYQHLDPLLERFPSTLQKACSLIFEPTFAGYLFYVFPDEVIDMHRRICWLNLKAVRSTAT